MHIVLVVLVSFGILTLWIPAYWPITIFQAGIFLLVIAASFSVLQNWLFLPQQSSHKLLKFTSKPAHIVPPNSFDRLSFYSLYPIVPLSFPVILGLLQWHLGSTIYVFETQVAILNWLTFLAIFLLGLCFFRDAEIRSWFRSAMLWFGFTVALISTLQTFTSQGKVFWLFPSKYTDYVMGPFINQNHYAVFIEIVLPIAIYKIFQCNQKSLLYPTVAAVMYASVIASASRAGTILVTAEVIIVVTLVWRSGRVNGAKVTAALLKMSVLFAAFVVIVGWQSVWHRFWQADPMTIRRELNISSIHMIKDHPWIGVGLGNWPIAYPRYAIIDIGALANQAHNDWLQWAAEGGIPLLVILSTIFFWSLRSAVRTAWGIGAVAVFLHALVDYPFSRPALGSWAILILAMLATEIRTHPQLGPLNEGLHLSEMAQPLGGKGEDTGCTYPHRACKSR